MVWCPCVCLGKSDRRRLLTDGGVLFQGCRLEMGGLLGGPRGGMVHERCRVRLLLGSEMIPS